MTTRLIAVVTRLSQSASRTSGEASATRSEPSRIDRATRVATGSPRNRANSPATASSERSPQPPDRAAAGRVRPAASPVIPVGSPGDVVITSRWLEPEPAQDRLAVRPGEPGQEVVGGRRVGRSLRRRPRHTSPRRSPIGGTSTVATFVDALASVTYDDPGIAHAELELGHDGLDVVFLGHDVGVVGGDVVRRVAGLLGEVRDEHVRVLGDRHRVARRDDLDGRLREVGRRLDLGRVRDRDDHGQHVAGEVHGRRRSSGPCRRASGGSSCRPTGRRRPGRPVRSWSRARTTRRSR